MQYISAIILIPLLFVLLVAGHIGAPWAGGEGVREELEIRAGVETIERGQSYETKTNEYQYILFEDGTRLYLDEKTTVRFDRIFTDETTLFLKKGRIYLDAQFGLEPIVVKTNFTQSSVDQIASFVNFDFLESILIMPIQGEVITDYVVRPQSEPAGPTDRIRITSPISIEEVPPGKAILRKETLIELKKASPFYLWVDNPSGF
mgnify:CR=1 FL=1